MPNQDIKWPWVPLLVVLITAAVVLWRLYASGWLQFSLPFKNITPLPSPKIQAAKLICPVGELCKSGREVMKNKDYVGFGINKIATDSAITAVFDGQVMVGKISTSSKDEFSVIYILNSQENKQASYWIKGKIIEPRFVRKGEVIATASGQTLSDYPGQELIFALIDNSSGKFIKLNSEDFVQ